jgi:hypothetical protein
MNAREAIAAIPLERIYGQPLQAAHARGLPPDQRLAQHERLQPARVAAARDAVRHLPLNLRHVTSVAAYVCRVVDELENRYGGDGGALLVADYAPAGHLPVTFEAQHGLLADPEAWHDTVACHPAAANPAAVVGIGKSHDGGFAVQYAAKAMRGGPDDPLFALSLHRVHLLKAKDLLLCAAVQILLSDVRGGTSLRAAAAQLRAQMHDFDGCIAAGEGVCGEAPYAVNWLPFNAREADFAFGTKASVDEMPALAELLPALGLDVTVSHMLFAGAV